MPGLPRGVVPFVERFIRNDDYIVDWFSLEQHTDRVINAVMDKFKRFTPEHEAELRYYIRGIGDSMRYAEEDGDVDGWY